MPTDDNDSVQDSDACPSDDKHDGPNATDEDASPSQYKTSRCDDDDNGEEANDSESLSNACIDQDWLSSTDREAALKIDCKQLLRQFNQMSQDLQTIMHMHIQHNAAKRKRGAELPAPEPKCRAPFTPPRKAPRAISVQASQQHNSRSEESDLDYGGAYG
jgi:hypothetical protein